MTRTNISILLAAAAAAGMAGCGTSKQTGGALPPEAAWIAEAKPEERVKRMEALTEMLKAPKPKGGMHSQFILPISKRWPPGHKVTVAFQGGSVELHSQIAGAARVWPADGNIGLDFGWDPDAGRFRAWSQNDTTRAADIRIGFDQSGYWSCVGTDSQADSCARSNEASMNFDGFARGLPDGWRTTVMHEFGHAIGFEHEHQNPAGGCEAAFRWDDDPGYQATKTADGRFIADAAGRRPGIYTVLSGPPNGWSRAMVDRNLKQLPDSSAYLRSAFDPRSIMRYDFPEWMYKPGTGTACRGIRAVELSSLDREGVLTAYPRGPSEVKAAGAEQVSALKSLGEIPGLAAETKAAYTDKVKAVISSVK